MADAEGELRDWD